MLIESSLRLDMTLSKQDRIDLISKSFDLLDLESEETKAIINQACYENTWFTPDSCIQSLSYWKQIIGSGCLDFALDYSDIKEQKNVGIIMAGNLPLVGLHDLLMALVSGHKAIVKMSSDDKSLMKYIIKLLSTHKEIKELISIEDSLPKGIDAVIATGSNNSFRYFEYYFRDVPHILRKNRRSMAILSGDESEEELRGLAQDALEYFGLGCRNVSLFLLPETMDIVKVIDQFEGYAHYKDHNKHHNNYTYHKALFLMNKEKHLDNGFLLFKEERSLNAPLGTIYYSYYSEDSEIEAFIQAQKEDIQCIVGKNSAWSDVPYGKSQKPEIQDFADNVDSLHFLCTL